MDDHHFLRLAVEEAKMSRDKDRYYVGAVIVKGGRIISKDYSDETKDRGHAEELALKLAFESAYGATMYVTMEPCSSRPSGKPSCSDLIISSRIKRVVYGVRDPQVTVKCNGIERLVSAGIEVVHLKEWEEICKELSPAIFK